MGTNNCIETKDCDMKIKDGFIVNKVGTQYVVVPVGQASMDRHCMIRLNDTGAFLWNQLGAHATEDMLVQALLAEYAVADDMARADVAAFLGKLRDADLLDE